MYTAFEVIYPNVKSPPKRTLLLTSQGTELYLCGRKQTHPPALLRRIEDYAPLTTTRIDI